MANKFRKGDRVIVNKKATNRSYIGVIGTVINTVPHTRNGKRIVYIRTETPIYLSWFEEDNRLRLYEYKLDLLSPFDSKDFKYDWKV